MSKIPRLLIACVLASLPLAFAAKAGAQPYGLTSRPVVGQYLRWRLPADAADARQLVHGECLSEPDVRQPNGHPAGAGTEPR